MNAKLALDAELFASHHGSSLQAAELEQLRIVNQALRDANAALSLQVRNGRAALPQGGSPLDACLLGRASATPGQGLLLLPLDAPLSPNDFPLDDDVSQALFNQLGRLNLLHALGRSASNRSSGEASTSSFPVTWSESRWLSALPSPSASSTSTSCAWNSDLSSSSVDGEGSFSSLRGALTAIIGPAVGATPGMVHPPCDGPACSNAPALPAPLPQPRCPSTCCSASASEACAHDDRNGGSGGDGGGGGGGGTGGGGGEVGLGRLSGLEKRAIVVVQVVSACDVHEAQTEQDCHEQQASGQRHGEDSVPVHRRRDSEPSEEALSPSCIRRDASYPQAWSSPLRAKSSFPHTSPSALPDQGALCREKEEEEEDQKEKERRSNASQPPRSLVASPVTEPPMLAPLSASALASPPPPLLDAVERLLGEASCSWQFDAFRLDDATQGHALSCLAFFLFHSAGLLQTFPINASKLARFMQRVEEGYQDNPYHNRVHAADVLQSVHVLLHRGGFTPHYADPLTLMACYLAACVHDFEHVGLTNDFLIASHHPLAICYNDRAPLENHHVAAAFRLLRQPELNFLERLPKASMAKLRSLVVELVLGTDMKQHCPILGRFTERHATSAPGALSRPTSSVSDQFASPAKQPLASVSFNHHSSGGAKVPLDEAERVLALQLALKSADLGHLSAELSVHTRWVARLEAEFFQQGDQEKAAGMRVSPLFDRDKKGVSKSQVGFYDFAVIPLFHALSHVFPETRHMYTLILRNYKYWLDQGVAQKLLYKPKHQDWALRYLFDERG